MMKTLMFFKPPNGSVQNSANGMVPPCSCPAVIEVGGRPLTGRSLPPRCRISLPSGGHDEAQAYPTLGFRAIAGSPLGVLCHEYCRSTRRVRNCTRDEGGPFEIGNQVLTSSHRKLLSSKAMVVNVAETPGQESGRQG